MTSPIIDTLDGKLNIRLGSYKTKDDTINSYYAKYVSYDDLTTGHKKLTGKVITAYPPANPTTGQLPIFIFHPDTLPKGLDAETAYIYPQGVAKVDVVCENVDRLTVLVTIADRYLDAYVGTIPLTTVTQLLEAKDS